MSRSIVELATEVQNTRNAVNVSGLAQSFAKAMVDLGAHTNERNSHFITRAWISVLAEKSGTDPSSEVPWLQVDSVLNGNIAEIDREGALALVGAAEIARLESKQDFRGRQAIGVRENDEFCLLYKIENKFFARKG